MNTYRADLHIHTSLSPCGDLQMSPANIVAEALRKGLDVIGITDHNCTRQAKLIKEIGEKLGLFVLCGAEVSSKEEVHSLTFFPDFETLDVFQEYLDAHLPKIQNVPNTFGYQVCVNENEDIIFEEERLLISGLNQTIEQIEQKVHELGGLFIPAHINRPSYSIISQLGFVDAELRVDALELSRLTSVEAFIKKNKYLKDYTFIQNSDAHVVNDIGAIYTEFVMQHRSFDEIKMALSNTNGRQVLSRNQI
jgi:PHP family Zn ribbon phosphoesterase